MKTIGERFDEMAEAAGVSKTDKSYYFGRSCCFQIATEQKAIDIDKAKEAFNKTCGWLAVYPWYNGLFEEFVKAMEEGTK